MAFEASHMSGWEKGVWGESKWNFKNPEQTFEEVWGTEREGEEGKEI